MKVLISGASGLVGSELARQLAARGDQAISLVRRTPTGPNEIQWDPARGFIAEGALEGIDAVVNLSGASTGKLPWSKAYKTEMVESRLDSTRTLVEAINAAAVKPKVFVSGSASGFYGNSGDRLMDESGALGKGFLASLAGKWEAEATKVDPSVRLVLARTTVVLSRTDGALGRLLPLIILGAGGPLGSGKQWWGWISLVDEAAAIIHLIDTPSATGPFNLVAPEAATCGDVVRSLGKALGKPTLMPAPAFALRLALGEAADELLLASQKLSAQKLLESGYKFVHPQLDQAAAWVVGGD